MAPRVRAVYDEPSRGLLAGKPALTEALRLLQGGRVDAAQELLQPGLDDRALRFRAGRQPLQPAPPVRRHLADPRVERREPLVALPLEHLRRVLELPLEPLRARVADVREPLREHRLRLACEHLD